MRFNIFKRILFSPILLFAYFIERPPMKKADEVICVSDHVKEELINLHGNRKNIWALRTGVDLINFKPRNSIEIKSRLNLDPTKIYGLYIARGGYWNKGLDRVIELSKNIYNLNKNYRLLVIGSNPKKVNHLINKKFMILLPPQSRKKLPYYYNSADVFFNASRYEGGAPTLVTSEAMASKCLIICSKDSNQEIIIDNKNGLIFSENYPFETKRILKIIEDKRKRGTMTNLSLKNIKELSLKKWVSRYLKILKN